MAKRRQWHGDPTNVSGVDTCAAGSSKLAWDKTLMGDVTFLNFVYLDTDAAHVVGMVPSQLCELAGT